MTDQGLVTNPPKNEIQLLLEFTILALLHDITKIWITSPLSVFLNMVSYIEQYIYLATEQVETYHKICILIYLLTYICPSLFDCEVNTFFFIFVIFKL